jgi:ABC-type multidrug transport system ATPase subunit
VNEKIEKIGHLHDCKANVVGIYGVGGIGKTTLCKILCNELSGKYKGRTCHVELKSSYSSWKELLQKILIELIGFSSEGLQQLDAGEVNACS